MSIYLNVFCIYKAKKKFHGFALSINNGLLIKEKFYGLSLLLALLMGY